MKNYRIIAEYSNGTIHEENDFDDVSDFQCSLDAYVHIFSNKEDVAEWGKIVSLKGYVNELCVLDTTKTEIETIKESDGEVLCYGFKKKENLN